MRYTPEQKAHALTLYLQHGTAEAARQTGITGRSITTWAKQANLTSREEPKKASEARNIDNEARRVRVRSKVIATAEDLLERMDRETPAREIKDYAIAFGILLDKYRLEMGEVTDRTGQVSESELDNEIRGLVEKISARA